MKYRKKYAALKNHLLAKEYSILIGARQTGKSTLLKQLLQDLKSENETAILLNLERREILSALNESPENVFKYLPLSNEKRCYLLIDEVQYLQDPANFLKLLYDEYAPQLKIIATGSSAFYIDRHFKDSLVGRKKIFELKTLDFEEFLIFKEQNLLRNELLQLRENQIQKSVYENQMWLFLDEYLNYGGYPAVVLENQTHEKIERLQEIRDSFVKRDVLEAGINNEDKFYKLMILLASQIGNLLNTNELSNTLGINNPQTEHYLFVLQKCYHVSLVKPFFQNLRKELIKMPKLYFNDLGLRNSMINYFAPIQQRLDKGALLENYVYRRQAELFSKENIKFWRTTEGNEVDFVLENGLQDGKAIEVKFSESEAKINKYKKFTEQYPHLPLSFLSWGNIELLK